jgi:hypothetical protein
MVAVSQIFDRVKSVALWSANIRKLAKDHKGYSSAAIILYEKHDEDFILLTRKLNKAYRHTNIFFYQAFSFLRLLSCKLCMWLPAGAFFCQFWGSLPSLPSTFKIFRPWKKSSTKKSWPTFCDQYFWKFPIWNSRADEKRREIRMVKVNVIFDDIRLLICLTPLQVNWVMVIN